MSLDNSEERLDPLDEIVSNYWRRGQAAKTRAEISAISNQEISDSLARDLQDWWSMKKWDWKRDV